MKTSKIKEIKFEREWAGNYGTMYEFLITTEDGSYGYVNSKTPQFKQTIGEEITFETESRNNKWYLKIQAPEKKPFGGGFGGGISKEDRAENNRMIARQVALKGSIELVSAGKVDISQILQTAEKLNDWLNKK